MQKDVGMECQKVCKQGRDDIIVKVSLQSPIPTSFYITVANLHFWHSIPTSFYIFNVFLSLVAKKDYATFVLSLPEIAL